MERSADFGGILSETFAVLADAIRWVALYVMVVGGLRAIAAVTGVVEQTDQIWSASAGFSIDADTSLAGGLAELVIAVTSVVASYFLLSEMLKTRGRLNGGGTRIWAYVGLSILWALGFAFGLVLLVVPGLILLVRWTASTGFLIGARQGIVESFGSSWEATKGSGWPIFFGGVVIILVAVLVGATLGGAAGATGSAEAIGVVSALVEAFGNALGFAFATAVYHLVADGTEATAEIFE
ncbi:hypothetical protein [Pontixanthobacter aquaemixtae]|uniref:Membrane domain of glycerophosphoryl diester phosphodiesterase n=1 Tax=Pontixanthobacter aquaemixtae TaxID=1958940 RepID=A0A844ZX00_9SPHN|nr:hypothetical protein [Pontixanthobacter aquaemixtae]MXO90029.1 hypothetical protein [Pontixanthobacter aquaemixtae]